MLAGCALGWLGRVSEGEDASLDGVAVGSRAGCGGGVAFSGIEGSRVAFEAFPASLDLRGGLRIFPSACCWAKTGEEA